MAEIHKCGQGWACCDGNCTTCAANNCYTTNETIPNSRIRSSAQMVSAKEGTSNGETDKQERSGRTAQIV